MTAVQNNKPICIFLENIQNFLKYQKNIKNSFETLEQNNLQSVPQELLKTEILLLSAQSILLS